MKTTVVKKRPRVLDALPVRQTEKANCPVADKKGGEGSNRAAIVVAMIGAVATITAAAIGLHKASSDSPAPSVPGTHSTHVPLRPDTRAGIYEGTCQNLTLGQRAAVKLNLSRIAASGDATGRFTVANPMPGDGTLSGTVTRGGDVRLSGSVYVSGQDLWDCRIEGILVNEELAGTYRMYPRVPGLPGGPDGTQEGTFRLTKVHGH
jgi:hypothetical protein